MQIEIKQAKVEDWQEILQIAESVFGEGYLQTIDLEDLSYFLAINDENQILGFISLYQIPQHQLLKRFPELEQITIPESLSVCDLTGRVYVIKTLAIYPEFQKLGVGSQLFKSILDKCSAAKNTAFIGPAWQQGKHINVGKMLMNYQFSPLLTISGYWAQECDAKMFACPSRHQDQACVCSMVIYYRVY